MDDHETGRLAQTVWFHFVRSLDMGEIA